MLEMIAEMGEMNARLLGKMLSDVPEGRMCWQAQNLPNHPAWQLGHVTFVRASVSKVLGNPLPGIEEGWLSRFAPGSVVTGDPSAYPSKAELIGTFDRAHRHAMAVVKGADWEKLAGPNPVERVRDRLPTGRHLVTYLFTVHDGWHIGQIADWRRAAGLPRVL